jgi:hypothetical protein
MPPGWVLPFPLFILLLRPLAVAGRLLTAAGRLLTAAGRQPSDSAGSKVREITGRRLWLLIAINDFPSGVIFT